VQENSDPKAQALKLHELACDAFLKHRNASLAYDRWLQAVQLDPECVEYRANLARMCIRLAQPADMFRDMAVYQAQCAARMAPDNKDYYILLGELCLQAHKFLEAIAAFERALNSDPTLAPMWGLKGFCHNRIGDLKAAREDYERALELDPENGQFHFLLSCLFAGSEFNPERMAFHGEKGFTARKPSMNSVEACWHAALGYLSIGDYKKGWEYFEARFRLNPIISGVPYILLRHKQPLWRGERDCTVLVHQEHGFGDAFMMCRFLPLIAQKYKVRVLFECMPQMIDLMRHSFPGIEMFPMETVHDGFDYHLPMMSLPLHYRLKSYAIPGDGPYLHAEPHKIAEWEHKLKLQAGKKNLGIVWAGGKRAYNSQAHATDKRRSVPFDLIKPLLEMPDINWISLQAEHDDVLPNPGIRTFSDTAAIIHLLDGVVSVDTSVVNLAGAMGKKTWLLNRYDHCWRWGAKKTPWYPSVIDVRQTHYGEWEPVVEKIRLMLEDECAKIAA